MTAGQLSLRYLKSLANGNGLGEQAAVFAEARPNWSMGQKAAIVQRLKAGVPATDSGDLLDGAADDVGADFMQALRPLSLIGRLPLRRVPPKTPMLTAATGTTAHWVGAGHAVKLSAGSYSRENLDLLAVSAMSVATNESLQLESVDAENAILGDLLGATGQAADAAFINPAHAGEAGVSPASITSGLTPIAVAAATIAGVETAARTAMQALVAAGGDLSRASWVAHPDLAAAMSTTRDASGALAWPTVTAQGGALAGLPLLTSPGLEADSDGHHLVLLDPSQVSYAEAAPNLATSTSASIEMDDSPTGESQTPTGASANVVSMFQAECTALLANLAVNWKLRRAGAVQLVSAVPATIGA